MKHTLSILLICCPIFASAQFTNYYVDSTVGSSGNGSLVSPWKLLSNIDWRMISNNLANGINVNLNLKSGGVWRETLNVSGSALSTLTVQPYGSGNPPEIHADNLVTGWVTNSEATFSGSWKAPCSAFISRVFTNAVMCNQGTNQFSLTAGEWYQATNYLFLHCDAGNPDTLGIAVEGTSRQRAIYCVGQSNLDFVGLNLFRGSTCSVELRNGSNYEFRNCQFIQGNQNLYLNNSRNVTVLDCRFLSSYVNQSINVSGINASFAFYYCLFTQNELSGTGINISGGGADSRIVNCTFTGAKSYHLYNSSAAASVGITNCVFSGYGNGTTSNGKNAVQSTGGLITLKDCLVMKNGKDPTKRLSGVSEIDSIFGFPGYTATRYPAIWCFTQDDSPTLPDWLIFADMATNYGFRTTWFMNTGHELNLSASEYAAVQARVNAGQEVGAHTMDHVDLADLRAMSLQYVGEGSACTMIISNSYLSTTVTGGPGGEDLNISLTNQSFSTLADLVAYVNAFPEYSAADASRNSWNIYAPPWLLTNVMSVDIKTAPYTNYFDLDPFLAYEISTNVAELDARFTNYVCRSFAYPYGQYGPDVEQWLNHSGLLGARLAGAMPVGSYRLSTINPYEVSTIVSVVKLVEAMQFENSTYDSSGLNDTFTAHNITYASGAYRGVYCASFSGAGSYLDRPNDPNFDFSGGDWNIAAYCWPEGAGTRTIFSQGTDANNRYALYLDGNGAVHFDVWSGGNRIITLVTTNDAVRNGTWQYVDVAQEFNRLLLRVNHRINVMMNTTARISNYTGTLYVGCDYDFTSTSTTNYYQGLMDNFVSSRGIYFNTLSVCDLLSEEGDIGVFYQHGEIATPRSADAIVMDAVKDYQDLNTNFMVMTFGDAMQYIRTNGQLQADGLTYSRQLSGEPNYMPGLKSILRQGADASAVAGVTNLTDLNGIPITDGNGLPVREGYAIGAYESQVPAPLIFDAWLQEYGLPTNGSAEWADPDGDGMNNHQEWIDGTNPTNAQSVLRMLAARVGVSNTTVSWESVTDRLYYLQCATNLGVLPAFRTIQSDILGQAGTTSYADTNAFGSGPFYYRVGVQQ